MIRRKIFAEIAELHIYNLKNKFLQHWKLRIYGLHKQV